MFALAVASYPQAGQAQTAMISTNVNSSSTGWFAANQWKTNMGSDVPGSTYAVGHPMAGYTYKLIQGPNAAIGNNTAATRQRNVYTNGTPTALWTFPGDSLELTTNTEIRLKRTATVNTIQTVNFPGVGGKPGLILNGGVLNTGDSNIQPVDGSIYAVPGSQSYLCPGNNDGAGTDSARAFTIVGKLSGSGNLCLFEGRTNNANSVTSSNNTFSGQWIVKGGRLLGAAPDSLGTNSSFIMDPGYVLPVPPFSSIAPVVDPSSPPGYAVLEVNYDMNSAGTLTLVNGGQVRLHQNIVFSGVTIEGTPLSQGTYYYADLAATWPNNFDANGSGSITVQPYGPPPLIFSVQPAPQKLFAGRTAHFTAMASGTPPIAYQWLKNSVPITDGGKIAGATNNTLIITDVAAGDAANYSLRATDALGTSGNSSAAALTLMTATEPYEIAVSNANPVAFYQLNETADPTPGAALTFDYAGGYNGTFGAAVQNGFYNIAGPLAAEGFAGFAAGNKAAQFANFTPASRVQVAPWNLDANTVTLTAWINPSSAQNPNNALIFCRGGGTVAGLNYASVLDPATGSSVLGYNWNNEWEAYSWNSGMTPPPGQWSFVALVVTPTNATIHLMNTNGLASATHVYDHVVQTFGGTTLIGDDSNSADGARTFNGAIDDVAVFGRALSKTELVAIYSAAAGAVNYAPIITKEPEFPLPYAGQTVQFRVVGGGSDPLSYQWKSGPSGGPYVNLSDGGRISGATNATLIISNVADADAGDYLVTIANAFGSTNSTVANLYVQPTSPAENITMSVQQAAGNDWETAEWSDGQGASYSAAMKPGSTYELLPGSRMRTPLNPRTAVFPGDRLTLDGDGVRVLNPDATTTNISEIRFKQPNPGKVIFKKLVMNGGQLDSGNDGVLGIGGEINVLANAPFNNDSGNDRGYRIDAKLTGSGSIEYWGYSQGVFNPNYVNNLNIAGTNNTFSGKWNVVVGTLLGTGPNALGTNDIVVGPEGALQVTYDINNPGSVLFLRGRMYLSQNHTFNSVFIGGVPLTAGTYTAGDLATAYPTYFPTSWKPQTGAETITNSSGSITVLVTPAPTIVQEPVSLSLYPTGTAQFTVRAAGTPPLTYQWRKGGVTLTDAGNISGSMTTNLTIANVVAGNAGDYTVVVSNSIGSVTSVVATLTVLPTGPAMALTLDYGGAPVVQVQGLDWNTLDNWSDGRAASVSALANPGSTYKVVAGARLRSPAGAPAAAFPGDVLTVDGDGVFGNGSPTIGEIRLKHAAGGTVFFKKLVMNGGQLDSASDGNGSVVITGEMNILANTPLYNDGPNDRGFQIGAWLTGSGSIEFRAHTGATFNPSYVQNLNITGTSNTFSGTWNVVQGVLLGSAAGSLGTNTITVGVNGALETLYNLNNPDGALALDGLMYLHQDDSFRAVTVGGVELPSGTYTFEQLNASYPANFPATWTQQVGSGVNTGSGSITVGMVQPPEVTLSFKSSGTGLELSWSQGVLLEATNITGPWTPNAATSPFPVSPTEARKFYRVQVR